MIKGNWINKNTNETKLNQVKFFFMIKHGMGVAHHNRQHMLQWNGQRDNKKIRELNIENNYTSWFKLWFLLIY